MKFKIFPYYLTLIIFFFLNIYNVLGNYDYDISPLTPDDINITDIVFEELIENKTMILLNQTELKSNIFKAYIRFFINISSCDEISLKLTPIDDLNETTPVEIYFYLTDNLDSIIDDSSLDYINANNNLSIRTYDLSLRNLDFYYIKLIKYDPEITDNRLRISFYNTNNDISDDKSEDKSIETSDETSDDKNDYISEEKSDDTSDDEKSDDRSDDEKSDDTSDDEKSDDEKSDDEKSDDEKGDDEKGDDETSDDEKSADETSEEETSKEETNEEEEIEEETSKEEEREEEEEEIEELITYNYELKIDTKKDYKDDEMLPEEFVNKTKESTYYYYKRDKDILSNNKVIILTLLSSGLNNFEFKYNFYLGNGTEIEGGAKLETKHFFNGYSLIINNKLFGKDDQLEKYIKLELNLNDETEIITIKTRKYEEEVKDIKAGDSFDILLEVDNINKQCFTFKDEDKEYILNFRSLTKNINANISDSKIININKESMTHIIHTNIDKKICFTFEPTTIYNFGSISFEVMESKNSSDNIVIYNNFPVIRGLWTHHYLLKNTATFYKPEIYLNGQKVKVNFHMTKGYLELYKASCDGESCNFKESITLPKYNDINGFISIKEEESNDYSPLVYCTNENDNYCEFDIEIKNVEEPSYLFENLKVYSFNFEDDKETYKINTKELEEEKKNIIINIYSFYDEPNILIYNNNNEEIPIKPLNYYLMKNKLYYRIPYEDYDKTDYLDIRIDGKDGDGKSKFYYGINYQLKTENEIATYSLENSVLYYYQIKEKEINFDFINKDKDKDFLYTYILSVNSFGNELALKINEKNKEYFNNYIQKELNNNDTFEISDENGNDSLDLFNLEYHELSNKIFIELGHLYKNQLNKKNNEIVYTLFIFNINDENKIVINFRKYSSTSVKIEFDNCEPNTINELSKLIILNEARNICNKNISDYCEFTIKIKAEENDLNEEIDFSIQITEYKTDDSTLIYLPQNTYMGNNILIPNYNIKYYVEIEKGKEGKIYVDFPEGEGLTSATINDIDGENITLNYYNKAFDIKSEDTNKCEDICTIYINIFLDKEIKYKSWYKYNIYAKIKLKNEDKFNFYVPELEYIYGYLENENDEHSYVTKITKSTNNIAFHINCDDCHLNISYEGGQNNIDILFRDEFILKPENSNYDFKGKEIKYTIKNNNLVSNQRYIIKVIPFESSNELSIPVNSIKNEFCKIRGGLCTFVIRKEYYNKINKIRLLVPNHEKARINIEENGEKILNQNYEKEYIKQDIYYLNVKDSSNEGNYGEINIENIDIETTYKITVKLDYDEMITFVTTQYDFVSDPMKYIYPEDYIIKELPEGNIKISPLEHIGFLHYDINLIKGKGTVKSVLNNEEYVLESGFKNHINLLFESESDEDSGIEIKSLNEDFIFYYRIIKNNPNNNLVELNFQKTNYFKYLNNKSDFMWPLNFYMKVNITKGEKSDLKDINFNYKFSKSYEINRFEPCDEFYNVTFYLVDKKYIAEIKYKNDMNENYTDIEYSSEYRGDITAGYSLIKANSISEKINNNSSNGNYYLLISLNYSSNFSQNDSNQEINAALTAFDYNKDYTLPMNEYLLLLINQKRNISIPKINENDKYNPFIEFALQNINLDLNPQVAYFSKYGKTFYKLKKDQNYILTLNGDDSIDTTSNLLIKYGLSEYSNYSYFKIKNNSINYDEKKKTMSFERIMENEDNQLLYDNNDKLYDIYTIKIYQVKDNNAFIPKTIYENTLLYHSMKNIENSGNKEISYDISFIDYGYFYLSVLAEGRKGNVYEYLLYEPLFITNISNLTEANITITYEDYNNSYTPNYTRSVKFTADLVSDAQDEDYIKLSLKHKNYDDNNFIYVSTDDKLYNSTELYKDSEYKVINRNTSLIIPVREVKGKPLYIRIPCKDLCDYTFYYQIYKKKEVLINDNECFDININDDTVNFKYNIDKDNNIKTSLFTMTSYSISDLTDFTAETPEADLQKTYFNGYSYLYEPKKYLTEDEDQLKFTIKAKSRINVCHRFLNNNKANNNDTYIDYQKIIFDGDIKYSRIQSGKNDCFSIYKDNKNDITDYKINFITKTKNIKINLFSKNKNVDEKEEQFLDEESFSYTFKSDYDEFCISNSDDKSNEKEDASVLFQLLSLTNNKYINQTLFMPLIKGISTKQNLKKGEILYYRINENSKNSESINVNFQTISGNPKVYHSNATNFPYYNISDIKDLKDEITGFRNNIKYSIKVDKENEDIYQKPSFPVIVVYCPVEGKDDCNFYIEMSNNLEKILLNKNRKIYSYIDNETNIINQYKIDLSLYDIDNSSKIYIQLYSFTGKPKLEIEGHEDEEDNYNIYNDNGMIFNLSLNKDNLEFNIKISDKNRKCSNYSLFYYIFNNEKNEIYLPSGEVHYNVISNKEMKYYFQDKLKTTNTSYIVSINSINCDLKVNSEKGSLSDYFREDQKRSFQLDIKSDERVIITHNNNNWCEFTISAFEKAQNNDANELITNDRTYQYYTFSKEFKKLKINYLISKDELTDNKDVFIYISKKSYDNLKINYNIKHKESIISNNNEMIELQNLANYSGLNETFNLYILTITIEPVDTIENNDIFEFKIKINGNKDNFKSYLDQEEIESDIIVHNKKNHYYYEYYYDNLFEGKIFGQIYLDCKGVAQLVQENNGESTKMTNYINLENNPDCTNGCRIYFYVSIPDQKVKNNTNLYNIYNIYLVSRYTLNVYQNKNIYGIIYPKIMQNFVTQIDTRQNIKEILFNLNCLKCKMHIEVGGISHDISKSKLINIYGSNGKLTYYIESEALEKDLKRNNYYYFSIINPNSPKFIYQKESTICKNNCKYILPIYNYFSFTEQKILFYVPETEQVEIYATIVNMEDYKYKDFNIQDNDDNIKINSNTLPITNRLFIEEEYYKDKDVYILIEVNSSINTPFNLIVSEFNLLLDEEKVLYPKNILIIKDNIDDSISLDNDFKMRMHLINGSGYFSLNNKDEIYNLNYESQEIISIPYKNNIIKAHKSSEDEDFIVYLDIENNDDNIYDLIIQKTNYIKCINDDNEKPFTISFNIENRNKMDIKDYKDLFINYHFSKLEGVKKEEECINSLEEKFSLNVFGKSEGKDKEEIIEKKNDKDKTIKYYQDTRRGYIYISSEFIFYKKYNNFTLEFKWDKNNYYKNIYLEITPLYIDNKGSEPIELPRNTYIEYYNKGQNISFSKPNNEYNSFKIEYAYKDNKALNISLDDDKEKINAGKYTFNIKNDSLKYYLKIEKPDSRFFLKYTIKKENQTEFYLDKITLDPKEINKDKNIYKITFNNIKINKDNIENYNISYLIRLYDYLDYLENDEINNIYISIEPIKAVRKELNDIEKKENQISYDFDCGKELSYGDYSISVLGEVYYNDNVEYFAYNLSKFSVRNEKPKKFDETWFAPLIFVIVVFLVISFFIIKHCINSKKEKKNNPSEGTLLTNKISI